MPYKNSEWIKLENIFSGGYTDNTPSFTLADNLSPFLRNARLDWMAIKIRPWHNLHSLLTLWSSPKGIGSYLRTIADNDRIIVRHAQDTNKELVTITEGWVITDIDTSTDITSTNRMFFQNIWDIIYCMNGSDDFWKLDDITYTKASLRNWAGTIGFFNNNPDIITDAWSWFLTAWLKAWDVISISWSASNDWTYTIDTVTASTITLIASDSLVEEASALSVDISVAPANFAPAFSVDFSSSHFASGFPASPNIVFKSVWNNYEDFNSAWSDQFEFEEKITSLTSNDKTLLVFTPNSISTIDLWDFDSTWWAITYKTGKLQTREGTNTNATTVTVWVNTYFFTSNKKISRVVRGNNLLWFEILELSERPYKGISKIMSTLDDNQDDAFGYYIPKDNLIKWFFKSEWSALNDICIVYDIEKDAFLIDEQKFFFDWVNFKGKNYTISNVEAKVFEDEINQDDEDAWIPFEYRTKEFTLWDPSRKKVLWETRAFTKINELAVLTQEILVDGVVVDTKTIDKDNIELKPAWIWIKPIWTFAVWTWWFDNTDDLEEVVILRSKWSLNIVWKKIQFRYTCDTLWAKAQLENLQIRLEMKPWLANNLTV